MSNLYYNLQSPDCNIQMVNYDTIPNVRFSTENERGILEIIIMRNYFPNELNVYRNAIAPTCFDQTIPLIIRNETAKQIQFSFEIPDIFQLGFEKIQMMICDDSFILIPNINQIQQIPIQSSKRFMQCGSFYSLYIGDIIIGDTIETNTISDAQLP